MSRDNTKHGVVYDTWVFILGRYKWHIHAGSWSLVNWWREGKTLPYIGCSWILINAAVGHMNGSALMVIVYPRDTPTLTIFLDVITFIVFDICPSLLYCSCTRPQRGLNCDKCGFLSLVYLATIRSTRKNKLLLCTRYLDVTTTTMQLWSSKCNVGSSHFSCHSFPPLFDFPPTFFMTRTFITSQEIHTD